MSSLDKYYESLMPKSKSEGSETYQPLKSDGGVNDYFNSLMQGDVRKAQVEHDRYVSSRRVSDLAMKNLMAQHQTNPYAGMSGEEIYASRKQEEQAAKEDFWSSLWKMLGNASQTAQEAQSGAWVKPEDQITRARESAAAATQMREAKARQKEAGKALDWEGRQELLQQIEDLDARITWADSLEQMQVLEQQRQEALEKIKAGDLAAGNGERVYGGVDEARRFAGGTAGRIGSGIIGAVGAVGRAAAQSEAIRAATNQDQFIIDALSGRGEENLQRQRDTIEKVQSEEFNAPFEKVLDVAKNLDDKAAAHLQAVKEGKSALGQAGVDIAENVIEMGFDAGVGYLTGGGSLASMFVRVMGSGVLEAREDGADPTEQLLYGVAKGGIETLTEKMFDGVAGIYGAGTADDITKDVIRRLTENRTGRALLLALTGAVEEGGEEVLSDLLSPLAEKIYKEESLGDLYRQIDPSEVVYDFLIGAAIGGLGSAGSTVNGQLRQDLVDMDVMDAGGSVADQASDAMRILGGRTTGEAVQARQERAQARLAERGLNADGSPITIRQAVSENLQQRGYDKAEAEEVAELTAKQINGEELSTQDQSRLTGERVRNALHVLEEQSDTKLEIPAAEEKLLAEGFENEQGTTPATYAAAMREAYTYGKSGQTLSQALRVAQFADSVQPLNYRHAFELGAGQALNETTETNAESGKGKEQLMSSLSMLGTHAQAAAEAYEAGQDFDTYAAAMDTAAGYAANGGSAAALVEQARSGELKNSPLSILSDAQVEAAQQIGAQIRQAKAQQTKELAAKRAAMREQADAILAAENPEIGELGEAIRSAAAYGKQVQAEYQSVMRELEAMTEADPHAANTEEYQQLLRRANDLQTDIQNTAETVDKLKDARKELKAKGQRKKGSVSFDGGSVNGKGYPGVDRSKLTSAQNRVVAMVEALADIINVDYVFFNGPGQMGGAYVKGGTVYINISSGINVRAFSREIAAASLSHELTHFAQDFAPEEYAELRDFVVKTVMQKSPAQFDRLVKQQMRWEPGISYDAAVDELVANGCQTMLQNTQAVKALVREHLTLAENFQNRIEEIGTKIKAAFEGVDVNENAQVFYAARILQESYGEIQTRWDKAIAAATRNYNAQKAVERATGAKENTASEGGVQNMLIGTRADGIEVYETSEATKRLPWKERRKQFLHLMANEYRGRTAKFVRNGHTYYARFENADLQKTIYGDQDSNQSGRDAKTNLGADGSIFDLVENTKWFGGEIERGKTGKAHKDVKYWDYFLKTVQIDGKVFDLLANVRQKIGDSFVYSLELYERNDIEAASPRSFPEEKRSRGVPTASEDSITDSSKNSNTQNSQSQRWDNDADDTAAEAKGRELAYARLQAENAALHDAVEGLKTLAGKQGSTIAHLEHRLSLTKTPSVRVSDAQKLARQLIKEYDSRADYVSVQRQLKELGDYILRTEAKSLSEEEIKSRARAIAAEIVDNAVTIADFGGERQTAQEIAGKIKGKKLSIDRAFLGELDGVDGFNAFRRANFGNFTLAQRETNSRETRADYETVDQFYIDLQGEYGEAYFPNVANEGEQIRVIADMFERAKGVEVNPFERYTGEATEYLANKIAFDAMDGVMRPTEPTTMDKQKARQDALKEQIAELRKQGQISEKEAERLRDTVYDLSVALDKAESRYRSLSVSADARLAQVQAEGKARAAEIKANERAKANEQVAALKEHYQDMAKRARQGRQNTASRKKIRKLINELNAKLAKPSENRYIPRELVQVTIDVLEMIDVDTGRSERVAEKLADIRAMYEGYKADPKYAAVYDETVADMLDNLAMTIRSTKLSEMTDVQLDAVYQTLRSLNHVISTAVNVKIGDEERNAFELSREMTAETRDIPKAQTGWIANKYLVSHLRADVMFSRFGGHKKNSTWSQISRMLNDGQLKQTALKMELSRPFAELINNRKGMEDFTGTNYFGRIQQDKLVDIGLKDENGNAILVTHDIMVGIYMDLLNEDNRRHFIRGGKTIPNLQEFYSGKGGFGAGSVRSVGIAERLSELDHDLAEAKRGKYGDWEADVKQQIKDLMSEGERRADEVKASIERQMNDFDRAWIAATQQLMDVDSKKRLNETTMEVYGIEKARVQHYFPISTDPNFLNTPFESVARDMSLENAGFMKERMKASNPTLALGTFTVVNTQIDRVSQYCGLMPAIRNFGKIFNKTGSGYSDSIKNALNSKFGPEAMKYLDGLIADLTGSRSTESDTLGINQLLGKLRGNLAQTSLTLNVRVALAQAASYPTAAAELDAKSLTKAFFKGGKSGRMISRADQELIAKWSPLLWLRMQGYSTQELGDIKNNNGAAAKVWKKLRWATGWIQAVDGATVGRLWYASEYWVQDHMSDLEKGTDAYYEAVAKKFNDVVEKTQPNYTPMQRATILRDPSALVKTFTMFMTQRLQNFNIVYDATASYQKARADYATRKNDVTRADVTEAKQRMVRAVCSQIAQAAVYVGFKLFADALLHSMKAYRDDDTGELTAESISLQLIDNYIDAVMGSFLLGSELYSGFKSLIGQEKWYGLSVNGVDSINDMVEDLVALANAKDTEKRKAKTLNVAKSMAQLMGIPLNNAIKIGQATINTIEDISNGQAWQTAGFEPTAKQQRMATLKEAGVSIKQYDRVFAAADEDGNGSLKQDELGPYLKDAIKRGELSADQAESIWRAALPTSKKSYAEWLSKQK